MYTSRTPKYSLPYISLSLACSLTRSLIFFLLLYLTFVRFFWVHFSNRTHTLPYLQTFSNAQTKTYTQDILERRDWEKIKRFFHIDSGVIFLFFFLFLSFSCCFFINIKPLFNWIGLYMCVIYIYVYSLNEYIHLVNGAHILLT